VRRGGVLSKNRPFFLPNAVVAINLYRNKIIATPVEGVNAVADAGSVLTFRAALAFTGRVTAVVALFTTVS
jgi:hypothetical protein